MRGLRYTIAAGAVVILLVTPASGRSTAEACNDKYEAAYNACMEYSNVTATCGIRRSACEWRCEPHDCGGHC